MKQPVTITLILFNFDDLQENAKRKAINKQRESFKGYDDNYIRKHLQDSQLFFNADGLLMNITRSKFTGERPQFIKIYGRQYRISKHFDKDTSGIVLPESIKYEKHRKNQPITTHEIERITAFLHPELDLEFLVKVLKDLTNDKAEYYVVKYKSKVAICRKGWTDFLQT